MHRLALLSLLLLSACGLTTMFDPELAPLTEDLLAVEASEVWSIPTDARLPSDIAVLDNGGFGVLDGYRFRALVFGDDRSFQGAVPITRDYGTPVRASRATDGETWWVTVPDVDGILRVSPAGKVVQTVAPVHEDGTPARGITAIYDTGEGLLVGLADGRLALVQPETGEILATRDSDVDGAPFGMIVDIQAGEEGSGTLLVVDTFSAKVHTVDIKDTIPRSWVGRFGLWSGYLAKPKSAAPGPEGTILVADSELGTLQLFDQDGTALGVVARDGEILRMGHPIAVEPLGEGVYVALDALSATVWGFTLTADAVEAARARTAEHRHLRTSLVERSHDERLADGTLCFQCHDGTVLDSRAVWDPELKHHPVGVVPDSEVPAFFPLVDGELACTTCHSPHGTVELVDVEAVEGGGEVEALLRHAPTEEGDLFTRLSRGDSQLCVACHTEAAHDEVLESLGLTGASHPTGRALADALAKRGGDQGTAGLPAGVDQTCLSCHAVHGAEREGLTRSAAAGETCLSCHQEKGRRVRNHPLGEHVGADRRVQLSGLPLTTAGTQTCLTCHDLVAGRTKALLQSPETGALCGTCHDPAKTKGPHGKVKGTAGLSCLGCHDVHGAGLSEHLLTTLKTATQVDPQGCATCHAAGAKHAVAGVRPGELGHPLGVDDLTCESCHDAHTPGDPPECSSCHEEQGAAFDRGGHGSASCQDCHPAHRQDPVLPASLRPGGEEALNPTSLECLACHARGTAWDATKVAAYEHPTPVFTPDGQRWTPLGKLPLYDEGGNLMPPGKNGDLTCKSCHLTHGPHPDKAGDNLRRPDWQEACAACHGDEALVLYRYFHDPRARQGEGTP